MVYCKLMSSVSMNYVSKFCSFNSQNMNRRLLSETTNLRLSKAISSTGMCSRREAERWIREGRVAVNSEPNKSVTFILDESSAKSITIDGVSISNYQKTETPKLWAIYKQRGEVLGNEDPNRKRQLVLERFARLRSLNYKTMRSYKPLYFMEYNMEGLFLLSENLNLIRFLNSEKNEFDREYRIRVHGLITPGKLLGLRKGTVISTDGVKYEPMQVTVESTSNTYTWLRIVSKKNSFQDIKRIFSKLYIKDKTVICTRFGPFSLESCFPGGNYDNCREVKIPIALLKKYNENYPTS